MNLKELILQNYETKNKPLLYISGEIISVDLDHHLLNEGYSVKRIINYKVNPGRMMFFPSYMPHQYVTDMGYEPFRFIHWNCQAIPKSVLQYKGENNVIQKK